MKYISSVLSCSIIVLGFLGGCKEESVLQEIEEALPFEPEVIVQDPDFLNYRLAENSLYDDQGYGVVFSDSTSDTRIFVVASGEVICTGNGSASYTIAGDPEPFFFTFFGNEEQGYTGINSQFFLEVEGQQRIAFIYGKDTTDPCDPESASVSVDLVTEDRVEGSISGIAYSWNPIDEPEAGQDFCEILESIGPFSADFSISLKPCSI